MRKTHTHLAAAAPGLFSRKEIESYEELIIENPAADERAAAEFFERFPRFLLMGTGAELRREVVLYGPDGRALGRVDFFRREFGSKFWDIIELKNPREPVVVGRQSTHPRLSAAVGAAVSQAEDYRQWIDSDSRIRTALFAKGMLVYHPKIVIVVGRDDELASEQSLRDLYDRLARGPVSIRSYTDLLRFAKECYSRYHVFAFFAGVAYSREEAASDSVLSEPTIEAGKAGLIVQGAVRNGILLPGHRLRIGCDARIEGDVEAAVVEILGEVRGSVRASACVDIRSTGVLLGDITAPRIIISDGAQFKGSVDLDNVSRLSKNRKAPRRRT